jgi:cell division protein FtsA
MMSMTSRGTTAIIHSNQEITEHDVHRVMEMARSIPIPAGREIIHILPRGFQVDGQSGVRQPVGMSGCKLEVEAHVVMGATSFLQNVTKSVEHAGLTVESLVLEPVASAEAVLTEAEKEVGVALVDIGGGTTDVAIVVDGTVARSAIIPIGGNHVTSDLSMGLKIPRDEAERLKRDYGCALVSMVTDDELIPVESPGSDRYRATSRKAIADIIEPRMQELYSLIKDELQKSGCEYSVTQLVLTGGGSLLHGAPELAETMLDRPTRIGRPRNALGQSDALDSPIFATGVGLLYFGAARRFRRRKEASTQSFLSSAWEHLVGLIARLFGG